LTVGSSSFEGVAVICCFFGLKTTSSIEAGSFWTRWMRSEYVTFFAAFWSGMSVWLAR
jgi:hypothetical protein